MDMKSFGILSINTLKTYGFMCSYNNESKQVPEKKAICFELILLLTAWLPAHIKKTPPIYAFQVVKRCNTQNVPATFITWILLKFKYKM